MTDGSTFPDPTYRDTVLAPLFEAVKTHYAGHMGAINRAHLVMLCETGILTGDQGRKIAEALRDINLEIDIDELSYTGEHEDYFFLIEAELVQRLGDLGGMLHVARSRNDMEHTCFRIALREKAECLLGRMIELANKLTAKARAERGTLIVAYTHGQPAQPSTFGHYLSAVVEVLIRDAKRLEAALLNVDRCPLGAAAITTSGFPIDRQRVSDLLGFGEPALNSYGCIASVDHITGLYSAVKPRIPASRPRNPGHGPVVVLRGRATLRARQPGASLLDHAAKAEPGFDRTHASSREHFRRQLRHDRQRNAQHSLRRHERQRGRSSANRIQGL